MPYKLSSTVFYTHSNAIEIYINHINAIRTMETITIPKQEFEQMKRELTLLRDSKLYQRLLQFEKNIAQKKYIRLDLGF